MGVTSLHLACDYSVDTGSYGASVMTMAALPNPVLPTSYSLLSKPRAIMHDPSSIIMSNQILPRGNSKNEKGVSVELNARPYSLWSRAMMNRTPSLCKKGSN